MAAPLSSGLNPAETAFLCEMELVTVIPRQRLESIPLLGGATPPLRPPLPATLPLWLALLLKKQGRANIAAPPWLSVSSLTEILALETSSPSFSPAPSLPTPPPPPPSTSPLLNSPSPPPPLPSPPFLPTSTSTPASHANSEFTLPYHFLSLSHLLLEAASDDIPESESVRRLLRDIREARAAKLRKGVEVLEGAREVRLDGVGGLEVVEQGPFVRRVVDGLRVVGGSKELARRERERDEAEGGGVGGGGGEGEDDEDML